jgi:LysM repeat protein
MSLFGKWGPALLAVALLVAAAGCSPMDQGSMDEEKEPHFVLGKSRVNAMNYSGAIEAFEESLEANPHSGQAHYQLAMLYENQESVADPAAAIYHYQQYLKYSPKAENADLVAQHIATCKQQLAENVLQLPSTPAVQQQLEKLTEENRRLHDQLAQWNAYYNALQAAKTNQPAPQNNFPAQSQLTQSQSQSQPQPQATSLTPDDVTTAPAAGARSSTTTTGGTTSSQHSTVPLKTTTPRTYKVSSGETLASIARKESITLQSLQTANPGVNPRKLKAGQVLNLPPPGS